jgi:hypothetical protein
VICGPFQSIQGIRGLSICSLSSIQARGRVRTYVAAILINTRPAVYSIKSQHLLRGSVRQITQLISYCSKATLRQTTSNQTIRSPRTRILTRVTRRAARSQILVVPCIKIPNKRSWRQAIPILYIAITLPHPVPVPIHLPRSVACGLGVLGSDLCAGLAEIKTCVGCEDVWMLGAAGRAGAGGGVALPEENVIGGTFICAEGRVQRGLEDKGGGSKKHCTYPCLRPNLRQRALPLAGDGHWWWRKHAPK